MAHTFLADLPVPLERPLIVLHLCCHRLTFSHGQSGFFDGRFFRTYKEAIIPTDGPALSMRFTSPIDFILWAQTLTITQGAIRFEAFTGATSSGTWTPEPVIGVNRMSSRTTPFYEAQATIESGGSFTGGTAVDLILIRSSAANNAAQNVGSTIVERGLTAGTYYLRFSTLTGGLQVNDAAQLFYSIVWEERP